jgi:hypothetical protein
VPWPSPCCQRPFSPRRRRPRSRPRSLRPRHSLLLRTSLLSRSSDSRRRQGLLLVQVKPDQTAAFEELSSKLQTALSTTTDAALKAQGSAWKTYKASEPMGGNALYVVVVDPAVAGTEYNPIDVLYKTMTDEQKRAPETQEMFKRFANAFAGVNKLNITKVGG